ncbi:uncharacterized protein ACHE_31067A [Aspergillus chevalieri]|uniref:C6 transcription factor n=1 Tax=Aspergillus chevalieri TaxID=182096 RepID=A0A7R7ZLR0_ASPCH|nr:uncharacterized protein ACHE_31067A [Aspergillus chevalieri]BCR87080.1 hypothetical protein ACHE_31067A [Aspergillus chevalieri]
MDTEQHRCPCPACQNRQASSTVPDEIGQILEGIESPLEKLFFFHFLHSTSHILTLPSDQNEDPVISVVTPMAAEHPMVLKAVLCLGASHMMNHMSSSDTEACMFAGEKQKLLQETEELQDSRVTALQDLDSRTQERRAEYEALLTSYLLLYLYELSEGTDDESWQVRLGRARDIVFSVWEEQQGESDEGDDEEDEGPDREELEELGFDGFLMQFFLYHDILASVTAQRPKSNLISCRLEASSSPNTDQKEHMFGVYNGLIDIISRIASLRSDANTAPLLQATVIAEAVGIWQDIDDWKLPDNGISEDYRNMCEAWIAAAFIWLFSIVYPDRIADEKVQTMVDRGLQCLSSVELPGLLSFTQFPVFVIGMACIQQQSRRVSKEQLYRIKEFRQFRNAQVCRVVIGSAWEAYDTGDGHSWDWIRLMEVQETNVSVT